MSRVCGSGENPVKGFCEHSDEHHMFCKKVGKLWNV